MNSLITSQQKKVFSGKISMGVRKGVEMAVEEFSKAGKLNKPALQRALADKVLIPAVTEFVKQKVLMAMENATAYVKSLSVGKVIFIDALDGKEILGEAKDVFPSGIDSDFKNWGLNVEGVPTKKTKVSVFEMIKDGDFRQLFGSFGENLDRLCLTQAQIKQFCKKHGDWLRADGYATFFLFKVNGEYFVAYVRVFSDGLSVRVDRFSDGSVWSAEYQHRVVVPQL